MADPPQSKQRTHRIYGHVVHIQGYRLAPIQFHSVAICISRYRCIAVAMASSSSDVLAKRPRTDLNTRTALLSNSKQTKTALVQTLTQLKEHGLLDVDVTRGDLQKAAAYHSTQATPYGKVVQRVEIDTPRLKYLDIVHPFALLHYLSTISVRFASLMYECCRDNANPLRLIVYADEMTPGNPFRPEKTRTLQCIYWCFADWPAHVLSRTFAWPVLCLIRTPIVNSEASFNWPHPAQSRFSSQLLV